MPWKRLGALTCGSVLITLAIAVSSHTSIAKSDVERQVRFGAEMARQGNWREAVFRWKRALALDPENPRIRNNLAVAYESLGEHDKAEAEYQAAMALPDAPGSIRENHEMFRRAHRLRKADTQPAAESREDGGEDVDRDARTIPDAHAP